MKSDFPNNGRQASFQDLLKRIRILENENAELVKRNHLYVEQREAERALRQQQELYRTLVDSAPF